MQARLSRRRRSPRCTCDPGARHFRRSAGSDPGRDPLPRGPPRRRGRDAALCANPLWSGRTPHCLHRIRGVGSERPGDVPPDAGPRGLSRFGGEPGLGIRRVADVLERATVRRRARGSHLWRYGRAHEQKLLFGRCGSRSQPEHDPLGDGSGRSSVRRRGRWHAAPGHLEPGAGAVCWEAIDCVSWGSFAGALPSPAGPPARPGASRTDMALRAHHRTAAVPHCSRRPTIATTAPSTSRWSFQARGRIPLPPRSTRAHPSREATAKPPAPAISRRRRASDLHSPKGPGHRTHDRTPAFRFASDIGSVTFLCQLDRGRFRRCRSPFTTKRLRQAACIRHEGAGPGPGGATDPSPAVYRFRVRVQRTGRA